MTKSNKPSSGQTMRSIWPRAMAGIGEKPWRSPIPLHQSISLTVLHLSRRPGLDTVIPGLKIRVPGFNPYVHNTCESNGYEGINIGSGKPVTTNVLPGFKVLVEKMHELLNTLSALFAPLLNGCHSVFKVAGGVLKTHSGGHEEKHVYPAQPLLQLGFLQRVITQKAW